MGSVGREQRSQQRTTLVSRKGPVRPRSSHLRLWVAAFMHPEPEHLQSAHYLLTYLPTCLPAYLPTCLPAYLPTCLPAYLPTLPYLTLPYSRHRPSCLYLPYLKPSLLALSPSLPLSTLSFYPPHSCRDCDGRPRTPTTPATPPQYQADLCSCLPLPCPGSWMPAAWPSVIVIIQSGLSGLPASSGSRRPS